MKKVLFFLIILLLLSIRINVFADNGYSSENHLIFAQNNCFMYYAGNLSLEKNILQFDVILSNDSDTKCNIWDEYIFVNNWSLSLTRGCSVDAKSSQTVTLQISGLLDTDIRTLESVSVIKGKFYLQRTKNASDGFELFFVNGQLVDPLSLITVTPTPTATPKPTPTSIPITTTADAPVNSSLPQQRIQFAIGDVIQFGAYEQDNNLSNGKESINWRILSISDNQALIVASIGLDAVSFGKAMDINEYAKTGLSWETSDLRKWLNGSFIYTAFSKEEQSRILSTQVVTSDKAGTFKTMDDVFILSIDEAEKYFSSSADMACSISEYAKSKIHMDGGSIAENGYCSWWLRDMTSVYKQAGRSNFMETTYNEAGYVYSDFGVANAKAGKGSPVFCDYLLAVRPAMWILLDHTFYSNNVEEKETVIAAPQTTIKPTPKPTPKPTSSPTKKPTLSGGYMSDSDLKDLARFYFGLYVGNKNSISFIDISVSGGDKCVALVVYGGGKTVGILMDRRTGDYLGIKK